MTQNDSPYAYQSTPGRRPSQRSEGLPPWVPIAVAAGIALAVVLVVFLLINGDDGFGSPEPSVELVDAGAAPHQVLTLDYKNGTKSRVLMTTDMSIRFSGAFSQRIDPPQFDTDMELSIVGIDQAGNYALMTRILDVRPTRSGRLNAQGRAFMSEMERIKGMAIRQVMTPAGEILDSQITNRGRASEEQLREMDKSLSQIFMQFPVEPMGVGGKWLTKQVVESDGLKVNQEMLQTIKSIKDGKLVVESKITQRAPSQTIRKDGAKVRFEDFQTDGSSHITASLTDLAMTGHVQMKMSTTMKAGGQETAMRMDMMMTFRSGDEPALNQPDADGGQTDQDRRREADRLVPEKRAAEFAER